MNNPIKPEDITIKSVKIIKSLSEETFCYTATIYVNGKPFCKGSNHGHGGPDFYTPIKKNNGSLAALNNDLEKLDSDLALTPVKDYPDLSNNLELVVGELLNIHQLIAEAKNILKRISYFETVDGKTNLMQFSSKIKPSNFSADDVREHFGEKRISDNKIIVLNGLPIDEVAKLLAKYM